MPGRKLFVNDADVEGATSVAGTHFARGSDGRGPGKPIE